MTQLIFFIISLTLLFSSLRGQDFVRSLPSDGMLKQLTPEAFKNHEAVIILKEQSYQTNDREVLYRGSEIKGKTTQINVVLIAKLFTESAVKRYGNFEFSYREFYGNEIPNGFGAIARVLKPNGDIIDMSKENVKNIVSRRTSSGIPLARKVIFKIPDLAIGDVVQIEYIFEQKFARSYSGLFFYHEKDMVLFSNLYITLPGRENVEFISFPQKTVGEPKITQISNEFGAGETYFWSVRNLNPIPKEIYSHPFSNQSYLTAFVIGKTNANSKDRSNWKNLARYYYEDYLDEDDVYPENLQKLGFKEDLEESEKSFRTMDSLYTAIRQLLLLTDLNSIYPLSDDINEVFDTGKGDASDLAYIMYNIVKEWDIDVKAAWIRDQRKGIFEDSVPSLKWFDRIALKITIGNNSKLYDFDKSIPHKYESPWYLSDVSIMVIDEEDYSKEKQLYDNSAANNSYIESHFLKIVNDELVDSVDLALKGSPAQIFRAQHYNDDNSEVLESCRNDMAQTILSEFSQTSTNNFTDEKLVQFQVKGKCAAQLNRIENNYVVNLKTHFLKKFYNKIYSTSRRSPLVFETPFSIQSHWDMEIPDTYSIEENTTGTKTFAGPNGATASFSIEQTGTHIRADLSLEFPQKYLSVKNYLNLIRFLEDTINSSEQNLILKTSG